MEYCDNFSKLFGFSPPQRFCYLEIQFVFSTIQKYVHGVLYKQYCKDWKIYRREIFIIGRKVGNSTTFGIKLLKLEKGRRNIERYFNKSKCLCY